MATDVQTHTQEPAPEHKQEVHVTAEYTLTTRDASFKVNLTQTVQQVIDEAYQKLGEARRSGDQYFSNEGSSRVNLAPYLGSTLQSLKNQGIGVHEEHGKLVFTLEIDAETGGAA